MFSFSSQDLHSQATLKSWLDDGPSKVINSENVAHTYEQVRGFSGGRVTVRYLDWVDFRADDLNDQPIDVIVGSDLVYDLSVLPGLAFVIKSLLAANRSRKAEAYIACTMRKQESVATFLELVKGQGLSYEVVFKRVFSPTDCNMVTHEPLQPVTLFKIYE